MPLAVLIGLFAVLIAGLALLCAPFVMLAGPIIAGCKWLRRHVSPTFIATTLMMMLGGLIAGMLLAGLTR